jgi:ABC-type lipoprotein release transport system permease subunit
MAVAPGTTGLAVIIAVAVSILSAMLPVVRAANIPPAAAFRKVV